MNYVLHPVAPVKPIRTDVVPIPGEMFRFFVRSISKPRQPHLVDLECFWFCGQCDCENFIFNCQPKLTRGAPPADKLRCTHIKLARSYFLDEVLPRIAGALKSRQ